MTETLETPGLDGGNRDSHLLYPNGEKLPLRERILGFLESVDHPVSPHFVASSLGLNPDSTRKVLSKLYEDGRVDRPFYGNYSLTRGYDPLSENSGLRVQNLLLVAGGVGVVVGGEWVVELDGVVLRFVCGVWNDRVSVRVGVPLGLGVGGLGLLMGLVDAELGRRGLVVPRGDWMVRTVEVFTDYWGLRLEGVNAVTVEDFSGVLEKFYNRGGVRREVRGSPRNVSVRQLQNLISDGLAFSRREARLDVIERGLGEVKEALRYSNNAVDKMGRNFQTLLEDYFRRLDEG